MTDLTHFRPEVVNDVVAIIVVAVAEFGGIWVDESVLVVAVYRCRIAVKIQVED
jgi:hypothetical protein